MAGVDEDERIAADDIEPPRDGTGVEGAGQQVISKGASQVHLGERDGARGVLRLVDRLAKKHRMICEGGRAG